MKNIEKQELYNSIMNEVAKTVKRAINESSYDELLNDFIDNFDFDKISEDEWTKQYYDFRPYEWLIIPSMNEGYLIEDNSRFENNQDVVYPSKQIEDILTSKFGLEKWQLMPKHYNGITTYLYSKEMFALLPNIEDNLKIFDEEMRSYGYFRAKYSEYRNGANGQDWVIVLYNPIKKFDCNKYVRYGISFLYHLAPIAVYDNIKKNGLIPIKNQLYNNEPRTFFICGHWENPQLISIMREKCRKYNNYVCAIIPIMASKLPEHIKFYVDPNQEYCVYTNFIIRPEYIDFDNVNKYNILELKQFKQNEPIIYNTEQ